tara:strand:+ start:900 stop:1091 length:192 start_codon:yes stop_codon:yes gene_type:complete
MISKYLQIQLFYVALILVAPYVVSMGSKLILKKDLDDKMKGNIAAGLSVLCALLWLTYGKNMV